MRAIAKGAVGAMTVMLLLGAGAASADEVLSVTWRKAQLLPLGGGVGSIIIGDPSVIDVSVEGNGEVIVFGKQPGETNMLVLSSDGGVLLDTAVVVAPEVERHVSIISPLKTSITERSWNCVERCVQVLGPGGIKYAEVTAGPSGGDATTDPTSAGNAGAGTTAEGVSGVSVGVSQGSSTVNGKMTGTGTALMP